MPAKQPPLQKASPKKPKHTPDSIVFHEKVGRIGKLIEDFRGERIFIEGLRLPDEGSHFSLDEFETLISSSRGAFHDFMVAELGGASTLQERFSDYNILRKVIARNNILTPKLFRVLRRHLSGFNQHCASETAYLLAGISLDTELFELDIRQDAFRALALSAPFSSQSSDMLVKLGYPEDKIWDIVRDELVPIKYLGYGAVAGALSFGASLVANASLFSAGLIGFGTFFATTLVPGLTKHILEWNRWRVRVADWISHSARDLDIFMAEKRREFWGPATLEDDRNLKSVRDFPVILKP